MNPFTNCRVVGSGINPEVYHAVTERRGHRDYPVSKSMLSEFASCPARWIRGYERPESKALTNGSLVDCLLLTPEKFDHTYFVLPETYPAPATHAKVKKGEISAGDPLPWNSNASVCEAFVEANKGREAVKTKEYLEARSAVSTVLADSSLSEMLHLAQKQVMVVGEYHDRATGITVPAKALLDIVPAKDGTFGKFRIDFKSCRSAAMRKWVRDCFDYGYGMQAAFHGDLHDAATGEDRPSFAHIVQESVAPYHVEKRLLSVEFVELGRGQYMSALALYCRCLSSGVWPGYHADTVIEGFQLVQPEAWMVMAGDQRPFEINERDEDKPAEREDDLIP